METEIFKIETQSDYSCLGHAGELLREGKLVAFPTETVYGLGGNALDAEASAKIYAAKGRPSDNPLIVHIAEPRDAEKYCITCPLYYELAKRFMPGPITVILPKKYENGKPIIPDETSGGLDTVALRCPSHEVAHRLICEAGVPIAAPSANTSGRPSPTTAGHVIHDLSGKIDCIIDGGEAVFGLESTVVRIIGDEIVLLRPGAVTQEDLLEVTSKVTLAPDSVPADAHPMSPGLKYKHYAPDKPLTLLEGESAEVLRFVAEKQKTENCAFICYSEDAAVLENKNLIIIGSRNDKYAQAHRLFDCLRKADETEADLIYAHLPDKDGIGLAIYNRLIRAAAHRVIKVN